MRNNGLKILGLTGGIASGKSTVSGFLRQRNGYILDADKISHEVMLKGKPAHFEILSSVSGDILLESGEIDRKKLGSIVFADKDKLKILEGIIHKNVMDVIRAEIEGIRQNPGEYEFIVIDAPLLFEGGAHKLCDSVWVVRASRDVRVKRIMARNSLTKEQAEARIRIQTDWDNLQENGFVFIDNDGSEKQLLEEVNKNLMDFLV